MGSTYVSARNTSTAAATSALLPPYPAIPAISAASTNPKPPGVKGIAVSSRANEKTTSTSIQLTSELDTPTSRKDKSSTKYSDRWLTSVARVIQCQRARRSRIVLDRNLEVAWSHPVTGGRPKGRITAGGVRPETGATRPGRDQ